VLRFLAIGFFSSHVAMISFFFFSTEYADKFYLAILPANNYPLYLCNSSSYRIGEKSISWVKLFFLIIMLLMHLNGQIYLYKSLQCSNLLSTTSALMSEGRVYRLVNERFFLFCFVFQIFRS